MIKHLKPRSKKYIRYHQLKDMIKRKISNVFFSIILFMFDDDDTFDFLQKISTSISHKTFLLTRPHKIRNITISHCIFIFKKGGSLTIPHFSPDDENIYVNFNNNTITQE